MGTVAIPALSYPRFFKIVNPSNKNSRASAWSLVPITPTIPQQSVVNSAESDVTAAVEAAAAISKVALLHRDDEEKLSSDGDKDGNVDTARQHVACADDAVDRR